MGLITLQTPIVGVANASEDPKIASDLTILQTLLNGNIDITNLSAALQALIPTGGTGTGVWTTYSPTWTASPVAPSTGNGTLAGAYMTFGKTCVFRINLTCGASTNGGVGPITFTLPAGSVPVEQTVTCKLFSNIDNTNWLGFGYIPASSSYVAPFFPRSSSDCSMSAFSNAVTVDAPGIPATAGQSIHNGSNFVCTGMYQTT